MLKFACLSGCKALELDEKQVRVVLNGSGAEVRKQVWPVLHHSEVSKLVFLAATQKWTPENTAETLRLNHFLEEYGEFEVRQTLGGTFFAQRCIVRSYLKIIGPACRARYASVKCFRHDQVAHLFLNWIPDCPILRMTVFLNYKINDNLFFYLTTDLETSRQTDSGTFRQTDLQTNKRTGRRTTGRTRTLTKTDR